MRRSADPPRPRTRLHTPYFIAGLMLLSACASAPAPAPTVEASAPEATGGPMLINLYATVRELPPRDFPHELGGEHDLRDPDLAEHLDGFAGYAMKLGGGEMTADLYHLILHIQRVQHHVSVTVEPAALEALFAWAERANAILFYEDGSVRDPHGRVLLDPQGGPADPEATLPYPTDALARKQRSMQLLAQLGVKVPDSLPPIVSVEEADLRAPREVAQRALSLLVVAVRAESINNGDPWPVAEMRERFPRSFETLSPREAAFMASDAPERQDVVDHAWRYEALALLAWALQLTDALPPPTAICDVKGTVQAVTAADADAVLAAARLRSTAEILDAADLHYRLHWATRQATQVDRVPPPADLEPGVIMERRHALNWLLQFQRADWDDVDTPT